MINKRIKNIYIVTAIGILFFGFSALAQTDDERIEDLRKIIEGLEKEAQSYRSNIASEQAKAASINKEISILQNQIKKIQTNISITNTKIDKTKIEIDSKVENIETTEHKIDRQKSSIGELLLSVHRKDSESLLHMLVKNDNISDFLRQAEYTANINTSLIGLINNLKTAKSQLENDKNNLEGKKTELEDLNQKNKLEQVSLAQAKSGKDKILKDTKGQEAAYQKMLKDIEQKKSLFFTELRELETKIIQGGLYLVHVKADSVPPAGTKLFQWPYDEYTLTQGYGRTAYSKRGAYGGAPHNGVDMSAGVGTPVKAIGGGEIIANGSNSGWGNWVAIKHDNNLVSVYGHMSALSFLRVGTKVKVGEVIGFEGSTGNSTGSHLHLSIYKEFFTYLNEKNGQLYFNYFDGSLNPMSYL